jgi:hypothetical protein
LISYAQAVTAATKQISAITAELEIVRDSRYEVIKSKHPVTQEPQLKALLALKLQEVGESIPHRRAAERRFKEENGFLTRTLDNLDTIMGILESKEMEDPSARIDFFQAQKLVRDIESTRMPNIESSYQEACRTWFKPSTDPLSSDYSSTLNRVAHLAARLEYQESVRVPIQGARTTPASDDSPRSMIQETKTMMQFDVAKFIRPFAGDVSESDVLMKFSNWKSSWFNLLKEMETFRGCNRITLFHKLKDCLDGPALEMVSKYSCESNNSYDAAMEDLMDRFQDPISLAGSYITSGIAASTVFSRSGKIAIDHSFDALYNMRDVFERENVDMNVFALMMTFLASMSPEDQAKWNGYKARKKQEYKLRFEEMAKTGEPIPEWKAGMVVCREQFQAWLKLLSTEYRNVVAPNPEQPEATASNFALQSSKGPKHSPRCFICPLQESSHAVAKCPAALGMSSQEWFNTCRAQSKCAKCTNPYDKGHRCLSQCRICHNQGHRADHFIVMCPANKSRTASLGLRFDRSGEGRQGQGYKRPNDGMKGEASLAKWAKGIDLKIQSIANQMNKRNKPQGKANANIRAKDGKQKDDEK